MKPKSEYDLLAESIAAQLGIRVTAVYQGGECPPWHENRKPGTSRCPYGRCNATHGDRFLVTIERVSTARSISFPYWAPFNDCYMRLVDWRARHPAGRPRARAISLDTDPIQLLHTPSTYDVLACISSDMSAPTDPDEVAREYGEMLPSQAIAIAAFASRLQVFFTDAEREALAQIS